LYANWLLPEEPAFPLLGLVVSGGHSDLVLMRDHLDYRLLGQTRDDAAGEAFDKVARILGLGYPGGPAIAAEAAKLSIINYQLLKITLPRPMINTKDYDFSFSGLKTAVLYDYKKRSKIIKESPEYKIAMAKEIQQAVIDVLLKKTLKAVNDYQAKTVILGGGVTANTELREQLKNKLSTTYSQPNFLTPPPNLCLDNGAMVAMAAWLHFPNKKDWSRIKPNANLSI
ncbi:MAG: tRNA (adenosine(37)-N6)-threonylcarbamoyltransferase complex transferase subunit TsaD, partial [Candidatus Gribaldobacteria bacterium]|nr:tRNA (adenosine(37)-N6)-threonylcarbamoyltransferase complex transferase subunit TsaD [Candidatus Gribaldobacteria bacterium]